MELRHFRYFIAVAEQLHFSRAAEWLGIAAPTLTVQIQELERALGARLLQRSKRSVALTPAGEAFLTEARQAVMQFEQAQAIARRAGRGEIGRIELGYVGSAIFAGILQTSLQRFRQAWPHVELRVRESPMDELPGLIEDGRLDLAFVRLPVPLPHSLRQHAVWRDVFCLAVPESHPLAAARAPIRARQLANESLIVPEQPYGATEIGRRGRFEPRIVARPGSLLSVLTQVALGAGIGVVPSVTRDAVQLQGVVYRPLAGHPITSEIAAIYRRHERSAAAGQLIRHMVETLPRSSGF